MHFRSTDGALDLVGVMCKEKGKGTYAYIENMTIYLPEKQTMFQTHGLFSENFFFFLVFLSVLLAVL